MRRRDGNKKNTKRATQLALQCNHMEDRLLSPLVGRREAPLQIPEADHPAAHGERAKKGKKKRWRGWRGAVALR